MPQLDVLDKSNKKVGAVDVSDAVFGVKIQEHLVQKYVDMQMAARRRGTAKTKSNYAEVSGGGKKPWKQKGTGRARVGSSRSSLWRGGVTIFGPIPRSYAFKMSKKAKLSALKSILTDRIQASCISVVEKLELPSSKTKDAVKFMKGLGLPERTLFLMVEKNPNLELAVRNLPHVDVLLVDGLNAYDLLMHDKIVCTPEAIKKIEERLN
jgi:large subunit ribosomal protein L4